MNTNNRFSKKTVTMSNVELKQFYEAMNECFKDNNMDTELSFVLANNMKNLQPAYIEVMNRLYDPNRDQELTAYNGEMRQLAYAYADRDEQGNPITEKNGNYRIVEQIAEFQEAADSVTAKYNAALSRANSAQQKNREVMEDSSTVELFTWNSADDCKAARMSPLFVYYLLRVELD